MKTDQSQNASKSPAFDAVALLKADHQKVKQMFDQLDDLTKRGASDGEKGALVAKIRDELSVHESVENDVFFPAVREVLRTKGVWQEATTDQAEASDAIQALGEQVAAHAEEEERDVFPKVEASNIDTKALGAKMSERKAELKKTQAKSSH